MGQNLFVVKYNETTDLFMIHQDEQYSLCEWGGPNHPEVKTWTSLAAAQAVATAINGGTVGTTKP